MTTRRDEATFRVGADVGGVFRAFDRIDDRIRQSARRADNLTFGAAGRVGRAGVGLGTAAAAGAGLGAGLVIIEQLFERLFELFEDTPVMEEFIGLLGELLQEFAPLAGVLLTALIPVLRALIPAIAPVVDALVPLIELLGGGLLVVVTLLTPVIIQAARWLQYFTERLRDFIFGILRLIDRIPGVNLGTENLVQNSVEGVRQQLRDAQAMRDASERDVAVTVNNEIMLGEECVQRTVDHAIVRQRTFGGSRFP